MECLRIHRFFLCGAEAWDDLDNALQLEPRILLFVIYLQLGDAKEIKRLEHEPDRFRLTAAVLCLCWPGLTPSKFWKSALVHLRQRSRRPVEV